jgi:hypothetical protein
MMDRADEMYLYAKNFLKDETLTKDYIELKDNFYQKTLDLKNKDEKEKLKRIFYNIKILKMVEKD